MENVKLFDHSDVGTFKESMKNPHGIIQTEIYEDQYYIEDLIPQVHKCVQFKYANVIIFSLIRKLIGLLLIGLI